MSRGERNRIKIRVRTALAYQAKIEKTPPRRTPALRLHPRRRRTRSPPRQAADGKHLHRLIPDQIVHEPLITVKDFKAVQGLMATRAYKGTRLPRENLTITHPYQLRGRLHCTICQRKMQASTAHGTIYYRCLYPERYAKANHTTHPRGIYPCEDIVVPRLDAWLATAFAPRAMERAEPSAFLQ